MSLSEKLVVSESSSSSDFESQLSQLVGDLDSQLSVSYEVHALISFTDDFTLLSVSVEIREIRRRCFELKKLVT